MILSGKLRPDRDDFGQIAEIYVVSDKETRDDYGNYERHIRGVTHGNCQHLKHFVDSWRRTRDQVARDGWEFVVVDLIVDRGPSKRIFLGVEGDQVYLILTLQVLIKSDVQMAFKNLIAVDSLALPECLKRSKG